MKTKNKILIIEDDPTFQALTGNIIRYIDSNQEIVFVSDVTSALSALDSSVNFVISDYNILGGTFLDLAPKIASLNLDYIVMSSDNSLNVPNFIPKSNIVNGLINRLQRFV